MQQLQPSSGPGVTEQNLQTFQCDVGEGRLRVFRAFIGATPEQDVLYTDIEEVNQMGGFEQQTELKITAQSTDEYSVRCWTMTQAQRNQLRMRKISDANGQPEQVATVESVVPETDHPAESKPVLGSSENPLEVPYVQTPTQPPQPERLLTEDDLIASTLISLQQAAIDDMGEMIEQYVDDEKIKQMAKRICRRIEGFYQKYDLPNPFESDTDEV